MRRRAVEVRVQSRLVGRTICISKEGDVEWRTKH